MPRATATLSEFLLPRHGSLTTASHLASSSGATPCRSLPRSSAQPVGGDGKAYWWAYGAVLTVSRAITVTPLARSSSIASSVRLRMTCIVGTVGRSGDGGSAMTD
eukprot:scaffold10089_cov110-Isochrysis_galbana.AAC.4